MKTRIFYWSVFLMVAFIGTFMVSCGSDDDNGSNTNVDKKIIGLWHMVEYQYTGDIASPNEKDSKYAPYLYHVNFQEDGTCQCYHSYPDGYRKVWSWSYNESTQMLRIYGNDGDYTFAFNLKLEFMDNGDWVGTEEDFTCRFSRNEDEEDDENDAVPIIGSSV